MDKIAVGPAAAQSVDINASVATNLKNVARALDKDVRDLTVVMLERPRHEKLAEQIRETGARIRFIMDGDVAGAVMAATPDTGIDVLMGIGGAPEAVVAACAIRCIGGEMQCKIWPRNEEEWAAVNAHGIDVARVLTAGDLVHGDDIFFAATGITDGELLKGVHYFGDGATTQSVVMRSRFGTIRRVDTVHRPSKLDVYGVPFD
jgi:fructose-1,6-bisphosphatase II